MTRHGRPGLFDRSRLPLILAACGLVSATPLAADAPSLQAMCWKPEALQGKPAEKAPIRGDHRFDASTPERKLQSFPPLAPNLRGAIRRVKLAPGKKLVALTFDLCETPGEVAGYDGAVFDYLRANGIKATLFAGGKWMRSHDERARQLMTDPLFEIGNHAEAHRNLRLLDGATLQDEILGPQRAYETLRDGLSQSQCVKADATTLQTVPPRMTLFRFPFGACNAASMAAVNDAGLLAIQWDLSTGDPSPGQSANAIADAMMHQTKPGSIIIGHANGRGYHTAEALPLAIPKLRENGFEFVTVSELLAAGEPEIVSSCYDNRPGDTDKYDTFFAHKTPKPEKHDVPAAVRP